MTNRLKLKLTVLILNASLAICAQNSGFSQLQSPPPPIDSNRQVATIVDRVLKRGEGSVGDVKTSQWVPPTDDDIREIKAIGHNAISPLNSSLSSRRPFEQFLAVRLLAEVGGPDIVAPLKRALDVDRPNSVRIAALAALRSAPDNLAIPIVKDAEHDSDPLVAQRARDLLSEYYGLETP